MDRRILLSICIWTTTFLPLSALNLQLEQRIDPGNHELLDVEIDGNLMIIPGGLGGATLFDISNPYLPQELSTLQASSCEHSRTYNWEINGNFAFGAGRDCGVAVYDITLPPTPLFLTQIDQFPYLFEDLEVCDTLLVAALRTDGVGFFRVTDPHNTELIALVDTENAWSVAVSGTMAYVADGDGGLKIIDFSDLESPFVTGSAPASGSTRDVKLDGPGAWLAAGSSGVDLFDVSDPSQPQLLDNAPTIGFAARVAPASGRVAAGCWEDVEIFQWDGNTLEKVGYKNTGGRVMAVGAVDDIIYSAEWRYLQVLEYGAIALPDADFSSRELNFPATEAGNSVILPLTIYSNGGTTLEFTSSYSSNVEFVLEGDLIPVLAGDSLEFTVRYNASAGSASGELILLTNDHDEEEVRVQLNGNHNGVNVNEPAPLFNLPIVTNGSGEFNLAEHAGEIIVLAFFATW